MCRRLMLLIDWVEEEEEATVAEEAAVVVTLAGVGEAAMMPGEVVRYPYICGDRITLGFMSIVDVYCNTVHMRMILSPCLSLMLASGQSVCTTLYVSTIRYVSMSALVCEVELASCI